MTAVVTLRTDAGTDAVAVPRVPSGYRAQLDGLRALAVYLVVAFHAGSDRFTGGFIGVDIFFVLSGYLVTQLLLRDLDATGGIGFAKFYSRRFRRLLPAAFATLLVTGIVFAAVAAPAEVVQGARAVRAAFLYVANWFFIRESSDYFGSDINANPVVHFWSLAIEEQFYLFWPLALGTLYAVTRRAAHLQWTLIRAAVIVGIAVSFFAAVRIGHVNLNRAYYGTDTRAYQLLTGAFLALTPRLFSAAARSQRAVRALAAVTLAMLVILATSAVDVGPIARGAMVAVVVAVLIISIESATKGVVKGGLSLAPITYLGRVSYGTYLWHWPIIVVATRLLTISPPALFLVTSLLATGIASLSYQILERPIRESKLLDRYRKPVIAVGLAVSVAAGLVLAPSILDSGRSNGSVAKADASTGGASNNVVPANLDWQAAKQDYVKPPDCLGKPVAACTLVHGTGAHVLLIGDSHAVMLIPPLVKMAQRESLTLSVATAYTCPWQQDLVYDGPKDLEACKAHKADFYARVIPELDPDIVIAMERTLDDPANRYNLRSSAGSLKPGTREFDAGIKDTTVKSVESFRKAGRKVVIIEPIPYAPQNFDPLTCISQAKTLDECRYVATVGPTPAEQVDRQLDHDDDQVWSMDMDKLVCPYFPICDPVVDGKIVKIDGGHLTATFSSGLSGAFDAYFKDNRIIP